MVKLTFKEVGQGDSIIIEWEDNGIGHVGLVDCNLKPGDVNETLKFLKASNYQKIEFIILSHPHTDHYSGMNQVLSYCEQNNIKIDSFYHTCSPKKEYLMAAVFSFQARKELGILFQNLVRLRDKVGLIDKLPKIDVLTSTRPLVDGFYLDFLSPTDREYDEYNRVMYNVREDGKNNNPDANILSTIVALKNSNYSILLTSDAVKFSLKRVGIREVKRLGENLLLAQLPHHGAESNHYPAFWKSVNVVKNMPSVISVGANSYSHPSLTVIQSMQGLGADIYLTNPYRTCTTPDSSELSNYLNWITQTPGPVPNSTLSAHSGDLVFALLPQSVKQL